MPDARASTLLRRPAPSAHSRQRAMRLVAWNCNMALHRKLAALRALRPDVAVLSECASPQRLAERLGADALEGAPVWIGANRDKGLAVLAFNGYRAHLADEVYRRSLRFIAPVRVTGPVSFNLLAVWAQNFSDGIRRKRQPGPLRLALTDRKSTRLNSSHLGISY